MRASTFRRGNSITETTSSGCSTPTKQPEGNGYRTLSIGGLSLRLSKTKRTGYYIENGSYEDLGHLGDLIFNLPNEIQAQILSYLDKEDFYTLRLVSHQTLVLLHSCASTINRTVLLSASELYSYSPDVKYIQSLFRAPTPCLNTDYLLRLLRRQKIIDKMICGLVEFIRMKLYAIRSAPRVEEGGLLQAKLKAQLQKPAWTLQHFLENYRELVIYKHLEHENEHSDSKATISDCVICKQAVWDLVNTYPSDQLIGAYHFYQLALLHLRISTREPSINSSIERKLRRWNRKALSDLDLGMVVIFGGLRELSKISMMRGTYKSRLEIVGEFVDKLTSSAASNDLWLPEVGLDQVRMAEIDEDMGTTTDAFHVPYNLLTPAQLSSLPELDLFFSPEWSQRIKNEGLIDGDTDDPENILSTPFIYVQQLLRTEYYDIG